ncbi:hypothetical protein MtrunA17_Chr2g0285741 [Medicago truncatula]|uniref:Uncharacterized protein n=1 Tax=Medicago truncatula TaxID=3880 RepID=A0A396J6N5_MEDTR|nr:hypothetical protein MtrunA17_Chr2g0285741 [Medicago truncatula]
MYILTGSNSRSCRSSVTFIALSYLIGSKTEPNKTLSRTFALKIHET